MLAAVDRAIQQSSPVCFFITIAVPVGVVEAVRAAHAGSGLRIEPTANTAAIVAAGSGRAPLLVTGGGCSCAWYAIPGAVRREARAARARARYERLGWSRAKIERALAGMKRDSRPGEGLHPVIVDLLRHIATPHGPVAAWVHDFHGKVETEAYAPTRRLRWSLAELDRLAPTLPLDTIVEIVG